jgi:aspartate-semialdehyde dehydrogenase
MRIAIIGATGLVGAELLLIAAGRGIRPEQFGLFASRESAGQKLDYGSAQLTVRALGDCDFSQYGAAMFCIGDDLSAEYVPHALSAGCSVVDKSNAFRLRPDVPLVVAGINDSAVSGGTRLVANPNCSTIILSHALAPWCAWGIDKVWVATYQSVSGAGKSGVEQLARGIAGQKLTGCTLPRPEFDSDGFAHNVIPSVGGLGADGRCSEETKLIQETRKVFGQPELKIVAHAARVPILVGHSMAVSVELARPATAAQLMDAWHASKDVRVCDSGHWPTPASAMHHTQVEAGRLRSESADGCSWSFFASGDNLTLGAALNGWRILELMTVAGADGQSASAGGV